MSCEGAVPHSVPHPAPPKAKGESGPSGLKGHEVEDGVPGDGHAGQRAFGSASSAALRVRTHGTGLPGRHGPGLSLGGWRSRGSRCGKSSRGLAPSGPMAGCGWEKPGSHQYSGATIYFYLFLSDKLIQIRGLTWFCGLF